MTGKDNPSLGEMIAEDLRRRLIELEAEVQVGCPGAQHRLDAVRSLLNLWNSFAWEHIVKRSDLVPPAAFELHSSRPKKYGRFAEMVQKRQGTPDWLLSLAKTQANLRSAGRPRVR